jgi:hypothetical protein
MSIARALFVLVLPFAVFVGGAQLMSYLTGRSQVLQRLEAGPKEHRKPLNQRLGYDRDAVAAHWSQIGGDTLSNEQRFLELDLVFPLVYGGAFAISLLTLWIAGGRRFSVAWLIAIVGLTIVSDWTENLVQLAQLRRYMQSGADALDPGWIGVASVATVLKLTFFSVCSVAVLALAIANRVWR